VAIHEMVSHTHYPYIDYFALIFAYLLIFDEGGKLENPEKNPRGMRENNIRNKLSSHITGVNPGIKLVSQR